MLASSRGNCSVQSTFFPGNPTSRRANAYLQSCRSRCYVGYSVATVRLRRGVDGLSCKALKEGAGTGLDDAIVFQIGIPRHEIAEFLQDAPKAMACGEAEALEMARRCPQITSMSRRELVDKIILLKGVLPSANIPELLYLRPSLLFSKEEDLAHAIRKMQALMPGTSPEAKLHQGGTAFWTFVELLGTSSATHVTSGG
mmetsp:Transcript_17217/g.41085  ORF Transcript_17217/g.41085 Transcript_17217/m.41085 type:complete len:199 (-) Transcript_17217:2281-2877(-)